MTEKRKLKRIQKPRNGIQFVVYAETVEELKPIVFFDAGTFKRDDDAMKIGFHPHSGIGIITYFQGTDLHHKDSGNNNGVILDGGMQWIRAGGGVWHEEGYHRKHNDSRVGSWSGSIQQLWVQLPPDYEESEVEYANLVKEELATIENVKVLVGIYKGVQAKMNIPVNMTYLDVQLKEGEEWEFETPTGQTTGFIYPREGNVAVWEDLIDVGLMGILEHKEGKVKVKASSQGAKFVMIIAEPGSYPVVSSGSQIHTNSEALERSKERIKELGKSLR